MVLKRGTRELTQILCFCFACLTLSKLPFNLATWTETLYNLHYHPEKSRGSAILTGWLEPGITATHVAVNIQPSSRKTKTAVTEGGIATSFELAITHIYGPMWHTQERPLPLTIYF